MHRSLALAICGCFWACALMSVANAETYRNRDAGFSVEIPRNSPTCRVEPFRDEDGNILYWRRDDGLDIYLDDGPEGCNGLLKRPFVAVFGTPNAMFDESNAQQLDRYCNWPDGPFERRAPPAGLRLRGIASGACRIDRSDGVIEIIVVAQGGAWPKPHTSPEWKLPMFNYTVSLYTTQQRFDADLARFRAILATVRIRPPRS